MTLSLTKTPTPTTFPAAGTIITYTYVIRNTGSTFASGPLTLVDSVIGSTSTFINLAPGQTQTLSLMYTTTAADVTAGVVTNTAVARLEVCRGTFLVSNIATATVTFAAAAGIAALTLTITATPSGLLASQSRTQNYQPHSSDEVRQRVFNAAQLASSHKGVNQGSLVQQLGDRPSAHASIRRALAPVPTDVLTVTVTNAGPATATGVTVTIPIPPNLVVGAIVPPFGGTHSLSGGILTLNYFNILPMTGSSFQVTVTATVAGMYTLTGTVSSTTTNPNPVKTFTIIIDLSATPSGSAALTTSATATPTPGDPNLVSVLLNITNTGPDTATGLTVNIPFPPISQMTTAIFVPAGATYQVVGTSYVVTLPDLLSGQSTQIGLLVSKVSASSFGFGGTITSATTNLTGMTTIGPVTVDFTNSTVTLIPVFTLTNGTSPNATFSLSLVNASPNNLPAGTQFSVAITPAAGVTFTSIAPPPGGSSTNAANTAVLTFPAIPAGGSSSFAVLINTPGPNTYTATGSVTALPAGFSNSGPPLVAPFVVA